MPKVRSHYVNVDGLRTHYLEAGEGPALVLLHAGEFGGCAELSWEYNIEALSESYHVYAPDWLGFGRSQKVFSFDDMWGFRLRHIAAFLRTLYIERAHFIGNSMGGSLLLGVAAMERPIWPMDRIVVASGGGTAPDDEAREVLNSYDGTREHMRRIVEVMFETPRIQNDQGYVERRWQLSREHGAWECTAAMRFKAPWRESLGMPKPPDYSGVKTPTLLVTGSKDRLREPGFGTKLQKQVPGSTLHIIEGVGHCPQIEAPDEFNCVALDFLAGRFVRGAT